MADAAESVDQLDAEVSVCRACPRLVEWRERVAVEKRKSYAGEPYWGRPAPGWGASRPRVMILGLAPAAHGAQPDRAGVHRRPVAATSCTRRCTGPGSPTSLCALTRRMDWRSTILGWWPRCAARRRGMRRRRPSARRVRRGWTPSGGLPVPTFGSSSCSADSRGGRRWIWSARPADRSGVQCRSSATARRPRADTARRGHVDRLLPPEPAEHVHRQAHPGDARRRLRQGRRRGIQRFARERRERAGMP